jgi:hypothetical protein
MREDRWYPLYHVPTLRRTGDESPCVLTFPPTRSRQRHRQPSIAAEAGDKCEKRWVGCTFRSMQPELQCIQN